MDLTPFRLYYEQAFVNQYYPAAVEAFEFIKEEVLHPSTAFMSTKTLLLNNSEGQGKERKVVAQGLILDSLTIDDKFAKLAVVFVSAKLARTINLGGSLNTFSDVYLSMVQINNLYAMILMVPSKGDVVTPADIRRAFTRGTEVRHTFIHEFTHYLQQNRWRHAFTPLLNKFRSKPDYMNDPHEREAWLTEALSRFMHKHTKASMAEVAKDYAVFKREFLRFLSGSLHGDFWSGLSARDRQAYLKDSFALVQKRVATTA